MTEKNTTRVPITYRLPCKNCNGTTVHEVLKAVRYTESDNDVDCSYTYEIIRCRGCEEISFRQNWNCSEDFDHDDDGNMVYTDHEELFPSRIAGRKELEGIRMLPPKVSAFYSEAHKALCYKLPILAGIGIRGLVESVCNSKHATGHTLEKQIDSLVEKKILTEDGAKILHGTRLLGNDAAHKAKPLSENQLNTALDVAEHLLTTVFILPHKAKCLPKRRKKQARTH